MKRDVMKRTALLSPLPPDGGTTAIGSPLPSRHAVVASGSPLPPDGGTTAIGSPLPGRRDVIGDGSPLPARRTVITTGSPLPPDELALPAANGGGTSPETDR